VTQDSEKKKGRIAQVRDGYTAIRQIDPKVGWWMLGSALATIAVAELVGLLLGHWVYALIVSVPAAALAATIVMNQRGNRAMYAALDGQPGAAGVAMQSLGSRGWYTSQEPVAVDSMRGTKISDLTGAAIVFRALGRPGVVLVGEGPSARVAKLLKAEEKRVSRVAPGVPVQLVAVGDGDGEVPIRKLSNRLTRMKSVLTKDEVAVVNKRLKSLGGLRTGIPAGIDPMRARVDRKALRGT
jgi:hypothetical protein